MLYGEVFMSVIPNDEENEKIKNHIGIKEKDLPVAIIWNTEGGKKNQKDHKLYFMKKKVTKANLLGFYDDYTSGRLN